MGTLPRLRRQRLWLALASLAFCLPWLVMVGGGRCALRSGAPNATAQAQPLPGACTHCCPPKAPAPARAAFCCETFRVGLLLNADLSRLTPPAACDHPPDGATFLDGFAIACIIGVRFPGSGFDSGLAGATPPRAFLRVVARRCFPSHAPPLLAALLS